MDEPVVILCPTCGAECTSEATFCGSCGSSLLQAPPHEPEAASPPGFAPAVGAVMPEAAPPAPAGPAQVAAGATRHCNWCGAESPTDARRCAQCGAMFPTPESEAAYMSAAEERLRSAQESLDQLRRSWRRRGIGRLFDN